MKYLIASGLAGVLLSGCLFQESKDKPESGSQSGITGNEGTEGPANYVPKLSDQAVLDYMVDGGFSAQDIRFDGKDIIYQEDIGLDRENVEREILDLRSGTESLAKDEQGRPAAKVAQRALSTNPKVSIADVPKLWYSMSSDILAISGLADIIHDSYAEYQSETNFEFVYTTNYAWCNNTPYKCTRWYANSSLGGLALASWPWQTSASAPPFKVFIAPGPTIQVNPTSWASSSDNPTPLKSILHEIGHTLGYTHSNVAEGGTQTIPGTSSTTISSVMCANFKGTLGDCTNYSYLPYYDRVALKWSGYRTANP